MTEQNLSAELRARHFWANLQIENGIVVRFATRADRAFFEKALTRSYQDIEKAATEARREEMECGHPKACLVQREISNIEKNEGPLNDTEYCSACAERERVVEKLMPFTSHKSPCLWDTPPTQWYEKDIHWQLRKECSCGLQEAIRQLDLIKDLAPSSTKEETND